MCERASGAPCQECRTCRRVARGNHPDLRISGMATQAEELKLKPDEAARQKVLRIETIREFQRDMSLKPYEAQRRVFILHDAERLSEQAANALLKTLEEPPPFAVLILVADTQGDLLPTVVSRCRPIRLRTLPHAEVASALCQRGLDATEADLLARWSGGRVGWALRMLASNDELAARQQRLDALVALPTQGRAARFAWAEELSKLYRTGDQHEVFDWLELWQSWWRDTLLVQYGGDERLTFPDRRDTALQVARRSQPQQIAAFVARIAQSAQQLRENANPQLVLENLVLHIP
jgi:DNA polymerase III subunit delta'